MTTKAKVSIEGLAKGAAMETMIKDGASYKDAEKRWKDEGARSNATGFRAVFYDALKDGDALDTKESILEFMKSNGASVNDIKQYTHFLTISKLIADVRS